MELAIEGDGGEAMIKRVSAVLLLCVTATLSQEIPSAPVGKAFDSTSDQRRLRAASSGEIAEAFIGFVATGKISSVNLSDDVAEGQKPTAGTDNLISTLQGRAQKAPDDPSLYDQLGAAYLQKARETNDAEYYDLAEKTLRRSLELPTNDFKTAEPLVHLALVYMGEHRFAEALSTAQEAMGQGSLAAFAIEGDAYTDLGEYRDAARAYQALQDMGGVVESPSRVAYMADSRLAYLQFLNGDTTASIRLMKQSIMAAMQLQLPSENMAWLYYELGERCFQRGNLEDAGKAYAVALNIDDRHFRSLAGLAKVRAAQGKFEEAIQLYKRSIALVPFPQYVADLGDVYLKLGRNAEAKEQYDLVEYIGYLGTLNRVLNNRELAVFYADREIKLPQALQLARGELNVRHDVYTWDALAWVLFKNRQLAEARMAIDNATSLHTEDSMILFHAGAIYQALGQVDIARAYLTQALRINPHFHIFYAEQANGMLESLTPTPAKRSGNESN